MVKYQIDRYNITLADHTSRNAVIRHREISNRAEIVAVDVGILIGYRFTFRLTGGFDGIYRTNFGEENKYFVNYAGVYRGRCYVEFGLFKGLYSYGEFEVLKVAPTAFPQTAHEKYSENTLGSYVGLGKRFNISRSIKGTMLGLYRIEYQGSLPNVNTVNVRMGFELNMNKRKRPASMRIK